MRWRRTRASLHPILTCADSRVPPEIIFDKGLGDIFDVRVAGNVAGDDETASLEYAAEHLHVPLVVVMGHSDCGALCGAGRRHAPGQAAEPDGGAPSRLDQSAHEPGDRLDNAIRDNVVRRGTAPFREPGAPHLVETGKLRIVGASTQSRRARWLAPGCDRRVISPPAACARAAPS